MTEVRFRELSSAIVSCAAQLVYTGKTGDSYRLLSAADRLFRSFADPGFDAVVPLADSIALARCYLDVLRLLVPTGIELVVDLEEEMRSASFIRCGSLVDAIDQVLSGSAPRGSAMRVMLVPDRDGTGGGLVLVGGERRLRIHPEGGP